MASLKYIILMLFIILIFYKKNDVKKGYWNLICCNGNKGSKYQYEVVWKLFRNK